MVCGTQAVLFCDRVRARECHTQTSRRCRVSGKNYLMRANCAHARTQSQPPCACLISLLAWHARACVRFECVRACKRLPQICARTCDAQMRRSDVMSQTLHFMRARANTNAHLSYDVRARALMRCDRAFLYTTITPLQMVVFNQI